MYKYKVTWVKSLYDQEHDNWSFSSISKIISVNNPDNIGKAVFNAGFKNMDIYKVELVSSGDPYDYVPYFEQHIRSLTDNDHTGILTYIRDNY